MVQDWIAALPEKTGRTLERWIELARSEGPRDEAELRAWLQTRHGHGSNAAAWIAERSVGRASDDDDTPEGYLARAPRYVDDLYAGPKSALRPAHDALIELVLGLGDDVRISPGKTIVPIYRRHVIAQIKPSTRTRIDFGLALGELAGTGRLLETGGFGRKDRITHRLEIRTPDDVDATVGRWAKAAYDRDGGASRRRGR